MNDPLEKLIAPHETFLWLKGHGILLTFNPRMHKEAEERGKYVVYQKEHRLNGLYGTEQEARARIDEIVGNKRQCLIDYATFTIRQL